MVKQIYDNVSNGARKLPEMHLGPVSWSPFTGFLTKNNLQLAKAGVQATAEVVVEAYDWAATVVAVTGTKLKRAA